MLDKILREIVGMVVGKGAEPIADLLNSNKYVNEFNIAKSLGMTINQTRNILYKISDFGLISSERKKDAKKGWYTYFWKFEILKSLEFLKNHLLEKKTEIEVELLKRKEKQFYVCEGCNLEFSGEEALLMDFTCDECGELFTVKDNSQLIVALTKSQEKLIEKITEIEIEIENEKKKLDKKKQVQLKKEEKEKEEKKEEAKKKREEKRKEREALKPKKEKKEKKIKEKPTKLKVKKVVKKKVVVKTAVKKKKVSKK